MPEESENYIRIPTGISCSVTATIDISKKEGIKALYCGKEKKVRTYLFDKKKWTMERAREWVNAHKTIKVNKMKKYIKGFLKKSDDDLFIGVASTKDIDRDGESIDSNGWKTNNFKKNPVMLWAHDQKTPSIGKVIDIKAMAGKLKFGFRFAATKMAKEIKELYKGGFLNAFSVGFRPLEREGDIFTKTELLEISAVNVPSNPNALIEARSKGFKSAIRYIKSKGIIPFKSYTTAPENLEWDVGKEVGGAEIENLKQMCTWYDETKPEIKSSYKLPHHTKQRYRVVWRGVATAMAALLGARDGVKIPEADRQGVYNHLAKHYKQFDKEVPKFKEIKPLIKFLDSFGGVVLEESRRVDKPIPKHEQNIRRNVRVIGKALSEIHRIFKNQ